MSTYYNIRPADKDAINALYRKISGNVIYNFVSFNYTNSVDKCAEILKDRLKANSHRDVGSVIHIHGYIDKNMIMGVNDSSQIINKEFAEDKEVVESIVKPNQNTIIKYNYEKQLTNIIDSSNIICIYGMSLGETDKKWWQKLVDWLSMSENRALIILKYDDKYDPKFPFVQRECINEVVERFLSYCEQPDEIKNKITSRIYVEINHNIFGMDLRKEQNLK